MNKYLRTPAGLAQREAERRDALDREVKNRLDDQLEASLADALRERLGLNVWDQNRQLLMLWDAIIHTQLDRARRRRNA